jgi:hypothetical protein
MARKTRRFTVTGPGVDREDLASAVLALSYGITVANRQDEGEATFYIRDAEGTATARVERHEDGVIHIYSKG